jgi:hypothetical protein
VNGLDTKSLLYGAERINMVAKNCMEKDFAKEINKKAVNELFKNIFGEM